MKITNKTGLPQSVVEAVLNDPYDRGESDISVTQLVGPPQIRRLTEQHWDELEEDAIDRIWALLGQAVHAVLERAAPSELTERRLFATVNGRTISGQVDHIGLKAKKLSDYKVTSAWTIVYGMRPEWTAQLNCYAYLCRVNGFEVNDLEIVAFYRDWTQPQAARSADYPQTQVGQIPIGLWPQDFAQQYIEQRLASHFGAEDVSCTDQERWAKVAKWAVMKRGRKSALRVLDSADEATAWALANCKIDPDYYLQERPREYVRCERYCLVANVCPQWALELERRKELGDVGLD